MFVFLPCIYEKTLQNQKFMVFGDKKLDFSVFMPKFNIAQIFLNINYESKEIILV